MHVCVYAGIPPKKERFELTVAERVEEAQRLKGDGTALYGSGRWLEAQVALSSKKAGMWRGATPSSETDRVNAMSRELEWLELTRRYRERLTLQRVALEQLKYRQRKIENRLIELATL